MSTPPLYKGGISISQVTEHTGCRQHTVIHNVNVDLYHMGGGGGADSTQPKVGFPERLSASPQGQRNSTITQQLHPAATPARTAHNTQQTLCV